MIEVPALVGAAATRAGATGPVAVTPADRWMFLVAPGGVLRPELGGRLGAVLHGPGSWVPAPPTRTPGGRVRWEVHPQRTDWRMPDAAAVQKILVAQLAEPRGAPTFAATTARLGRAA